MDNHIQTPSRYCKPSAGQGGAFKWQGAWKAEPALVVGKDLLPCSTRSDQALSTRDTRSTKDTRRYPRVTNMKKAVSGGAEGVETIAIEVASRAGFETGGAVWKTNGWTEHYGMVQCEESGYESHINENIIMSNLTIIIAQHLSSIALTAIKTCKELKVPHFFILWPFSSGDVKNERGIKLVDLLTVHDTVNFTGNRNMDNIHDLPMFLELVFMEVRAIQDEREDGEVSRS